MVTEKQILQEIKDTDAVLMEYRGKYHLQKPIEEKLDHFLQKAFQENPQMMVEIFWKEFERPKDRSMPPDYRRPPYHVYIFSTITDYPNPQAIELACQLLVHPNHSYQEDSARFLYDAKDQVAVPYLIAALKSEDYGVVRESAFALGNIGDPRAESHLLEIVDRYNSDEVYSENRIDDANPIIRASAFNALCLLDTTAAHQKVLESIFYDRDEGIQRRAIRHLVTKMPEEAISYLEELLATQPDMISRLVATMHEESIPYLKVLTENEDSEIASLAEKYLEEAKQSQMQTTKLIIETMQNIVNTMPGEAIPYLERLSEHPKTEISTLARKYLSELRS